MSAVITLYTLIVVSAPLSQNGYSSFSFLSSDHHHQADYSVAMVRAGYVCVAIIHKTLTWTVGSLTCAQMLMHAIAHTGVQTPKESLHRKLTLGRKSLAALGDRTCVSGVTVRCSTNSTITLVLTGQNSVLVLCTVLRFKIKNSLACTFF